MKVYIKCPPYLVTGGPEFLQQVCAGLRDNDIDAYMYYENESLEPQPACYTTRYNNPYVSSIPDTPAALIVPEIYVTSLFETKYKDFMKFILWESVNFYLTKIPTALLNMFPENTIHLYPTQYAKDYLTFAKVPEKDQIFIPDYISEEFLNIKNTKQIDDSKKQNLITYYIPKGNNFTKIILQHLKEKYNYDFLALENYSTQELIDIFCKSKVFLDFSYFPGKNRMHREASTCRNIIFTSSYGAARSRVDVNIKDEYKFLANEYNIKPVEDKIRDCIENFDKYITDFDEHREETFREKEVFNEKIKDLAKRIREEEN